jgi:hypothetical protein
MILKNSTTNEGWELTLQMRELIIVWFLRHGRPSGSLFIFQLRFGPTYDHRKENPLIPQLILFFKLMTLACELCIYDLNLPLDH